MGRDHEFLILEFISNLSRDSFMGSITGLLT